MTCCSRSRCAASGTSSISVAAVAGDQDQARAGSSAGLSMIPALSLGCSVVAQPAANIAPAESETDSSQSVNNGVER